MHAESMMILLGLQPVPLRLYKRKNSATSRKRYMTAVERSALLDNIIKRKRELGDTGTAEFIYYDMLDDGELPNHEGDVLVSLDTFLNYYKSANYQITGKHIDEKKVCERCGTEYGRKATMPYSKFKKQRFCSKNCACLDTASKRMSKANERKEAAI